MLQDTPMAQRESALFAVTPGTVIGLVVVFLLIAACFAVLKERKVRAVHSGATALASAPSEVKAPPDAVTVTQTQEKTADKEERVARAETALAQAEKENADLRGKLDVSQQEIAALRHGQADTPIDSNASASVTPEPAENTQTADLQSQVNDLRNQLDGAEKEKALLAEKLEDAQQRLAQVKEAPKAETRKKRETSNVQRESSNKPRAGVHGTVLAYNQAYNFVVLNLGARNGVESNSEMLVLRDGTLIGKIRISSVEPATAIGDIITNSLARGVQVQPGDSVIYAGTSP